MTCTVYLINVYVVPRTLYLDSTIENLNHTRFVNPYNDNILSTSYRQLTPNNIFGSMNNLSKLE